MTHDEVVATLVATYPGVEWSYDGDGATLDPVAGVSCGLVWHDASAPPSLSDIEAAWPAVEAALEVPPPLPVQQRVFQALNSLDANTASAADIVNAVKVALK